MQYATFTKMSDRLRISLTSEGREELQDRLAAGIEIDNDITLYDVLEHQLCNGWEWIRPEELGALTAAPILSDDCERDEDGLLTHVDVVYWYEPYQVRSPVGELVVNGHVDFQRAN